MDDKKLKILVVGSGGREHALVWKLKKSKRVDKIFCAPGNGGTAGIAENINIDIKDLNAILNFVLKEKIDLTIVGPEGPLIAGIVELFESNNLKIIGPNKYAAQIEGSKIFAKNLMKKYGIPTANYNVFNSISESLNYLKSQKFPQVIKSDGPYLGKGVCVAKNLLEAQKFINKLNSEKIVIEEYLEGQEVSFTVLCDGIHHLTLFPSQDHKRIYDGDLGPNTGGIGAYAPVPFVNQTIKNQIEKNIINPLLKAFPYKGILYPGIILTSDGPKVLEFNCRFGDPETQPILTLLKTDLVEIFLKMLSGDLDKITLEWKVGYSVCVVLASGGYPEDYQKDKEILGLSKLANKKNVMAFHSGTKIFDNKILTNGGRVLGITAISNTLKSAINKAYKNINLINFENMYFRKDIAQKGLKYGPQNRN